MQKLNNIVIGLLLVGLLTQPALATTGNQIQSLNSEELSFAFNDSNAGSFEILSPEEMANTEGASFYLPWMTGALHFFTRFASQGRAGFRALREYRRQQREFPTHEFKLMNHKAHHRNEDDGLFYRHWQITRFKRGDPDSHESTYFPYGGGTRMKEPNPRRRH